MGGLAPFTRQVTLLFGEGCVVCVVWSRFGQGMTRFGQGMMFGVWCMVKDVWTDSNKHSSSRGCWCSYLCASAQLRGYPKFSRAIGAKTDRAAPGDPSKAPHAQNGSRQGPNLALTVLFVPISRWCMLKDVWCVVHGEGCQVCGVW